MDTDTPDTKPEAPAAPPESPVAAAEPAPRTITVRASLPVQGIRAGKTGEVDAADPEVAALLAAKILVRV